MTYESCRNGLNFSAKLNIPIGSFALLASVILIGLGSYLGLTDSDPTIIGFLILIGIGIVALIQGAFSLAMGIFSYRAWLDPSKAAPVWFLAMFNFIFSFFGLIMGLMQFHNTGIIPIIPALFGVVLNGLFFYMTTVVKFTLPVHHRG